MSSRVAAPTRLKNGTRGSDPRSVVVALILTAASLAIGAIGALLTDCSSSLIDVAADDPLQLCASVASIGMTPEPWMGIGLMVVGALGVVAAWAPTRKRRATKADLASIAALKRNLDRVEGFTYPTQPLTATEIEPKRGDEASALRGLIEDLRHRFESPDAGNGVMTTWIATLHICNDLNNAGVLTPTEFKALNTSLLALVTPDLADDLAPTDSF